MNELVKGGDVSDSDKTLLEILDGWYIRTLEKENAKRNELAAVTKRVGSQNQKKLASETEKSSL